jgi:cation diffusion facilitator family transporter
MGADLHTDSALKNSENREKKAVALNSVAAAVLLTAVKIIVGVMTASLGILAEAAHSALDLMAAVMAYIAVKISGKPADKTHLYGHGKVENLSALFETLLLLITCVWIIYEAVERLFFSNIAVKVNFWSFAVMLLSVIVDRSRSRMLYRAAKKFNSQALEADALHFRTDIWSSCVVIFGLALVKLSEYFPNLSALKMADSFAAIVVAFIVVAVSFELGKRSIQALIDAAPPGMESMIKRTVESIPEVLDCHAIRLRYSGALLFIDIHVLVDGNRTLNEAHEITDRIENTIQQLIPAADITVHPEPVSGIENKA